MSLHAYMLIADNNNCSSIQVGGSKNKIPKTEEIQSLEYRYRVELEAVSDWENVSTHTEPDPQIEHAGES